MKSTVSVHRRTANSYDVCISCNGCCASNPSLSLNDAVHIAKAFAAALNVEPQLPPEWVEPARISDCSHVNKKGLTHHSVRVTWGIEISDFVEFRGYTAAEAKAKAMQMIRSIKAMEIPEEHE